MPSTTPPPEPEALPAIGRPATRALAGIGVTRLSDVRRLSERELLAVHGVGPKAVRLLRAALEARGMTFRES